jgi:hypothetical protein
VSRLRRFLHIERSRDAGAARPASGAELDRFGAEPPPKIELVETAAGDRPFTRCMRCGMDHHVLATGCSGCGARLDTAEQHAFNERLWARRQEEAEREARAAQELRDARARADAELAERRRAMGEELAREVGDRERRRLGMGGWSGRSGGVVVVLLHLLAWLWRLLVRRR